MNNIFDTLYSFNMLKALLPDQEGMQLEKLHTTLLQCLFKRRN